MDACLPRLERVGGEEIAVVLGLNVIIWNEMLTSRANVIIWEEMLSSGANVIIWE